MPNSSNQNPLEFLASVFESEKEKILSGLFTFIRFKTISAQSDSKPEMEACVEWLTKYLNDANFKCEVWETTTWPAIFAEWNGAGPSKPTLLFYGHYDVQPVDPLELWTSPPFEPEIRDGNIFGRGAQDNKGQLWLTLSALTYLLKRDGKFPFNIKILIDGEEECGSAGLKQILPSKSKELEADYLAIVDFGIADEAKPSLSLGMRGIVGVKIELTGSSTDLHSGFHGGVAYNPNHALVEILSKMRDSKGKIAIPGFYDEVAELSEEELEDINFDFDDSVYFETFGAEPTGGEQNFSPNQSRWIRPTLEINGVGGGYVGEGLKTVIPAKALAQITCRLVPDQNPLIIANLIVEFVKSNLPKGISLQSTIFPGYGEALRTSPQSKIVQLTAKTYSQVLGKPVKFILEGWTVPIVAELTSVSKGEAVLLGFALPGDLVHAPNEHFSVDRIKQGFMSTIILIEELANS